MRIGHDAGAESGKFVPGIAFERNRRQTFADAGDGLAGAVLVGLRQDDRKLVASPTGTDIRLT